MLVQMFISTNNSRDNSTENDTPSKSTIYLISTVGSNLIVSLFVMVNNILLLITLAKTRQLWTLTNAYIASLSVADLLIGVVLNIRPFWLIPNTEWVFDDYGYACLSVISLLYVSSLESLTCLVLVSMDRYLFIVHPYWYKRNVTPKLTGGLIAGSWVSSAVFGFLPMRLNNFSTDIGCSPMTIISRNYLLYFLSSYFLVAASTITAMYGRIYCVGNQQRRKIEATARSVMSSSSQRRKEISMWRVVRFLLLVCGVFFSCWIPLFITVLCYFTIGAPGLAITITVSIAGLNSSMNFFVFIAMDRTFKQSLLKLICRSRGLDMTDRPLANRHNSNTSPTGSAQVTWDMSQEKIGILDKPLKVKPKDAGALPTTKSQKAPNKTIGIGSTV